MRPVEIERCHAKRGCSPVHGSEDSWIDQTAALAVKAALFRGNRRRQCSPSKECTRLIGPAQAGYGGPRTGPTRRVSSRHEALGTIVDGGMRRAETDDRSASNLWRRVTSYRPHIFIKDEEGWKQ